MLAITKRINLMKKNTLIIVALILLVFLIYKLIFILLPSVEILNKSDKTIVVAKFYLSENRIVMDNVLPNEKLKIYYDLKQRNCVLKILITLIDSTKIEGNCGEIKNYAFGNRIQVKINEDYKIICAQ